jgi:hypothetical protein
MLLRASSSQQLRPWATELASIQIWRREEANVEKLD